MPREEMATGAPPEAPWVRFSQSEDLTVRLRNILHDYAFGPGVFRELLQNADDAGARRLVILADGRTWAPQTPGEGLLDERLGAWQGPAVLAFNDAEFSDADFDGICRVGASGKRGDSSKIGQYGLGFNATYHLSDVVSFVSRDRLCVFDPHEAHLPGNLPGLQLRLGPEEQRKYAAQLAPFEAAAAAVGAEVWPLSGAIFRLPLRSPQLAAKSQICADSHTFDELVSVLRELLTNAYELLLFLQSVESVEVLVIGGGAPASARPLRLGGASLRSASEDTVARLRRERRLFSSRPEAHAAVSSMSGAREGGTVRAAYAFLVDEVGESPAASTSAAAWLAPASAPPTSTSAWLVLARAEDAGGPKAVAGRPSGGGPEASKIVDEMPKQRCGAVALRLWPLADEVAVVGGAFCYLPLSIGTGLPVHASANFALTANRRDLWRKSDDRAESLGNKRADWNEALLSGTLPRAYADALELRAAFANASEAGTLPRAYADALELRAAFANASEAGGGGGAGGAISPSAVLSFLPEGPWSAALLKTCAAAELWASFPAAASASFEALPGHVAAELFQRGAAVLWDEVRAQFSAPKAAMLCTGDEYLFLSPSLRAALQKLHEAGARRSVVEVPARMCPVLQGVKGATWLNPQSLSTALRSSSPHLAGEEADAVVEYLLGPQAAGPFTMLHGLRLCPLLGGGLGRFERPGGEPGPGGGAPVAGPELWWSEDAALAELLPGRPFVDPACGVFRLLKPRVHNAPLNIRFLNARSLPQLLPGVMPIAWGGKRKVCVSVVGVVVVDGEPAEAVQEAAEAAIAAEAAAARNASVAAAAAASKGKRGQPKKAPKKEKNNYKASPPRSTAGGYENYWDDWEGDWQDERDEEAEDAGEWEEHDDEGPSCKSGGGGGSAAAAVANDATVEEVVCRVVSVADLHALIRRCELLWHIVEISHEKGTNPMNTISDFPCIPVAEPISGWDRQVGSTLRLMNLQEASRRNALAVEDFTTADRACLEQVGVAFVRPVQQLRKALNLDKTSTLAALQAIFAERWVTEPTQVFFGPKARLYTDLKALRLPLEDGRSLRALVKSLMQKNHISKDTRQLESLPIFETQGGNYCVPLLPTTARVLSPSEDWDDALRPDFADFLISFDGETGQLLSTLGKDRSSTASFLAEFASARVGLFGSELCVKFLEAAASLGKALWNKTGAPKQLQTIAQACQNAPLIVLPSGERRRCSELADPGDAALTEVFGSSAMFPPEEYRGDLTMSVMRQAGLRRFSDPSIFLQAASEALAARTPRCAELCAALLRHLAEMPEALKWPSQAFSSLGRLPIFPVFDIMSPGALYPPSAAEAPPGSATSLVSLEVPCLFRHAAVAWTQVQLLDPGIVDKWSPNLRRRFGMLKDPPPLDLVISNLAEVTERWSAAATAAATESDDVKRRQAVIGEHLTILRELNRRSKATKTMVQARLVGIAFLVLDDGALVKAPDIFQQLHTGGDSDEEEEEVEDEPQEGDVELDEEWSQQPSSRQQQQRQGQPKGASRGAAKSAPTSTSKSAKGSSKPWLLPAYLRPFRRLLLGIAGPVVNTSQKVPQIHVPPPPEADCVPKFMQQCLNRPELADVELVVRSEDGLTETTVYAHRLILAAACDHFRSSFTSGLAEAVGVNGRCRLEMPEWVTPTALLWMLAYLYQGFDANKAHQTAILLEAQMRTEAVGPGAPLLDTVVGAGYGAALGTSTRRQRNAMRAIFREADGDIGEQLCCLLRLSEFYALDHLKAWCECRLQGLLAPDNLIALSTHAFFCGAHQLLRVCVYNMRLIYSELVGQDEWETLEPGIKELVLTDLAPALAAGGSTAHP
mmetsp:Transcript_51144/g.165590  ORF Transcript_51144/g.165590 Transcript_51144/m.165590 type:complete len:1837 (-) Transcript_51144:63-5573(-)